MERWESYDLYARLIGRPPTSEALESAAELPPLSETISSLPPDADEREALHHQIFGFEVLPLAGAFLDPRGLVGGSQTDVCIGFYQENGLLFDPRGDSVEHLSRQLQVLSMLSREGVKEKQKERQRRFLDSILLPWLPAVVLAIEDFGHPFYTAVSREVWRTVAQHRSEFPVRKTENAKEGSSLLDNPKTGLAQISSFLSAPQRSGFWFSRAGISRVSRSTQLPRGFAERRKMVQNLLHTAAGQGAVPAVTEQIAKETGRWRKNYAALRSEAPHLGDSVAPWQKRLAAAEELLGRVGTAAQETEQ
jgi:hypothetical protein